MRYKVIWMIAGMIALWMVIMGGTIMLDFDRVQQSNQATAELEWTFICDELSGGYAEIDAIEGGESFIGRSYNGVENTLIDEKGRALSETYDSLQSIGNGYVRFENTPHGGVIMDEGKSKRADIGVLNDKGEELPEEEVLELLYGDEEKLGHAREKKSSADSRNRADDEAAINDADMREAPGYNVAKGDRKYVGIKDSAGNWFIPPVFDKIEITTDQKYAVIKNGSNIGIAALGSER